MNTAINILIITGNEQRHRYFATEISKQIRTSCVFFEQKANVHKKIKFDNESRKIIDNHFSVRDKVEGEYFPDEYKPFSNEIIEIETGKVNDSIHVNKIVEINPDYILLFGSSIIREGILERFPNRVINLHLGLSPYYRGSGTNFWPLVHGKPECVGATIHLATLDVDAGGIIHQVRPDVTVEDTIHDIGNKTIIKATNAIPAIVELYFEKKIEPKKQNLQTGIVCKRKDITAEAIIVLYQKIDKGMIAKYCNEMEKRRDKYPIIKQIG